MAHYYLPVGTWVNYLTGETAEGGVWRREHHGYLSIPLWVRENSIVATGIRHERADYRFEKNLELKVFALRSRAETVIWQDGTALVTAVLEKDGGRITGHVTGAAGCRVRLVNCPITGADGAEAVKEGADTVLMLRDDAVHFTLEAASSCADLVNG